MQTGDTAVLVSATALLVEKALIFCPYCGLRRKTLRRGSDSRWFLVAGGVRQKTILTSRLIDRPIRPLFPQWLRDDLQIIATTLSLDESNAGCT